MINKILGIGKGKSVIEAVKAIDDMLSKYPYDNCNKIGIHSFLENPFIMDRAIFMKPKELKFDNRNLFVPTKYDEVLKICYGDYMKLPPEEKRHPMHTNEIVVDNVFLNS